MGKIDVELDGNVAMLKLDRDVINAVDMQVVKELNETLDRLRREDNISGLVVCSTNDKFFSIGFDIPQIIGFDEEEFRTFFRGFNLACLDLYTFPKPTVAAITGHALAGGCILALCCDYRYIAEGRKLMGLNEIQLGVPVPYLADCIVRELVGLRNARSIMDSGEFYGPEQLIQMGMVDKVLSLADVLPQSIERVKLLGAMPQKAFAAIKHNRVERIEAQVLACREEQEQLFIDCLFSDEARDRVKEAMKTF